MHSIWSTRNVFLTLCVLLNPTCSWKLVKSLMLVMCGLCLMDTEIIVSQCILVYLFLGEIDHWWYLGLFQAHGIDHLVIPTRDYLFAPSFVDINRAVQFIHRGCFLFNLISGKWGRGLNASVIVVLCNFLVVGGEI